MNQFMVNNFVITSNSLLINDEIVGAAAMRAQDDSTSPILSRCATRNNQVWNEELVLTNIMRNNHRLPFQSRPGQQVRRPASGGDLRRQASFTQNKSDVLKNKIVIRS
jgi:hypothetical protein